MLERFTKQARAVIERAVEEAGALGADRIGPEHLLLGIAATHGSVLDGLGLGYETLHADLVQSGGALDADALAAIGIDLGEVERRVEASFGRGALRGGGSRTRFAPKARKALELALREAVALGDRKIGADHLLLGLMRDPGERVRAVLARRECSPEAVRAAVFAGRSKAA
jgi:ATP-dependent Clp protease ATP-binding subunit ClpA